MQTGNQSSSKKGYRNLKGSSQIDNSVQALSGGETFADRRNLQIWEKPAEPDYEPIDTNYGLSNWDETPDNKENTDGNNTWSSAAAPKAAKPAGDNRGSRGADPTPGGGWD